MFEAEERLMVDQAFSGNGEREFEKVLSPEARHIFSSVYGNLLAAGFGNGQKVVLICGPSGGEGASTVALGLAAAAAGFQENQVLLVDGNLRRPTLSKALAVAGEPGMQGILTGRTELDEFKMREVLPGLQFLGAGVTPADEITSPVLTRIPQLIAGLCSRYSLIVLDGPAVNRYPESILYAPYVDLVLLVLRAGVSRGPVVERALAKFTGPARDKVEIILNRRKNTIPQWAYKRLGGHGS